MLSSWLHHIGAGLIPLLFIVALLLNWNAGSSKSGPSPHIVIKLM